MTTGRYGTDGDDTNHPSQQDTNHPNQQDLSVEALTEMIETMELSDIAEMETSMKVKLENELEKYKLAKNKMKALKRVEKSEEKKTLTKEKNLLAKIEKKTQREAVASISLVNSTAGHTTVLKIIPLNNTVRMLRFLRGSSLRMSRKQSTKIEMTLGDVSVQKMWAINECDEFEISENDTSMHLKSMIYGRWGLKVKDQRTFYNGKEIEDFQIWANIPSNIFLQLGIRAREGGKRGRGSDETKNKDKEDDILKFDIATPAILPNDTEPIKRALALTKIGIQKWVASLKP
eukprot:symbB.v1.2.038032.t1/scaffold5788.1/size24331/2